MTISNLIKSTLLVVFAVSTGQMSGAASNEGRRIDSFLTESDAVPSVIGSLHFSYLPNSQLDRLRIHLPVHGAPVCTSEVPVIEQGSFEYVAQTEAITAAPIKVVSIAQILNANPFSTSQLPTARKWLERCVNNAGIYDLALGQSDAAEPEEGQSSSQASFHVDLDAAAAENNRNLQAACDHLPQPADASQRYRLAVLFGDDAPRPTKTDLVMRDVSNQGWKLCALQ